MAYLFTMIIITIARVKTRHDSRPAPEQENEAALRLKRSPLYSRNFQAAGFRLERLGCGRAAAPAARHAVDQAVAGTRPIV